MYRLPRRFKLIVAGIGVLALVAAGGAIAKAKTSGSPHYRLATASIGTVEQDLAEVGTVSAVNRVSVAFPVSGTVGSVPVSVGMPVAAGAVLASLTTGALDQQVASATSTLASAQQSLAVDEASETESTASLSSVQLGEGTDMQSSVPLAATGSPRPSGSRSGGASGTSVQRLAAAVTNDQQKLLSAQQKLDQDLAAAEDALASCLVALGSGGPTGVPMPTGSAPSSSAPVPTSSAPTTSVPTTSAPTSGSTGSVQCLAAIAQAPTKADTTADQQARDQAIKQLDAAIQALVTAAGKASSTGAKTSGGSTGRSGSSTGSGTGTHSGGQSTGLGGLTGTGGGSSARTASGPASAQQLAADQAEIDAAQAQLAVARQNRSAAVLTSPIAGTVAAVSITAGRAVSAGSTSSTITVIGAGQEQVSTTVSLTDLDSVKVDDRATVTVDGVSQPLTGVVSLIGVLNTSSGSTPSYPVTIVLDPTSRRLFDGSGASVQIQVASVSAVLTVPSSAVHTLGQLHTVTVFDHGSAVPTRITIGAVGSDRTQVTSGLKAGQQVVLADLTEPLPTGA
jgi:multidrug efflux pump subunit AcrA (membrane-fusion protein)